MQTPQRSASRSGNSAARFGEFRRTYLIAFPGSRFEEVSRAWRVEEIHWTHLKTFAVHPRRLSSFR
jgi:hypothetical protein